PAERPPGWQAQATEDERARYLQKAASTSLLGTPHAGSRWCRAECYTPKLFIRPVFRDGDRPRGRSFRASALSRSCDCGRAAPGDLAHAGRALRSRGEPRQHAKYSSAHYVRVRVTNKKESSCPRSRSSYARDASRKARKSTHRPSGRPGTRRKVVSWSCAAALPRN